MLLVDLCAGDLHKLMGKVYKETLPKDESGNKALSETLKIIQGIIEARNHFVHALRMPGGPNLNYTVNYRSKKTTIMGHNLATLNAYIMIIHTTKMAIDRAMGKMKKGESIDNTLQISHQSLPSLGTVFSLKELFLRQQSG